eukprot:scaffold467_cov403-Prasinococcus_capsulatus_cf.AAC.22
MRLGGAQLRRDERERDPLLTAATRGLGGRWAEAPPGDEPTPPHRHPVCCAAPSKPSARRGSSPPVECSPYCMPACRSSFPPSRRSRTPLVGRL